MNKILIYCLFISMAFHALFILSFDTTFSLPPKINFSHKLGVGQIKATLSIYERMDIKKQTQIKHKTGKIPQKIEEPILEKKHILSQNSKGKNESGNQELITRYLSNVRTIIAQNKFKKRIARKLKLKGRVKLNFIIREPNTISDLVIVESSGFKQLDDSALQTVETVNNLPIIPLNLNRVNIPTSLVINYE